VGVLFALGVSLAGPSLRSVVDLDRFRFGSAVALGMLPLSIFGVVPGDFPLALAVLGVTVLLAFDPEADQPEEPTLDTSPMSNGGAVYETDEDGEGTGLSGDPGLDNGDDDGHAPWL
jgi:hypothetical protein